MCPAISDAEQYSRACFVIMPYGVRDVGAVRVNFDRVYEDILQPAIRRVRVNGKAMIPRRADDSPASRILMLGMMRDLLKSRLAIADLTIENENVTYEVGSRHNSVRSGTVLLWLKRRSKSRVLPFNLASIAVNEYADTPPAAVDLSIDSIADVLRTTLRRNEVDSPRFLAASLFADAMGSPDAPTQLGLAVADAELAGLHGAPREAAALYSTAVALAPDQPLLHQRQGTLYMQSGDTALAQQSFQKALQIDRTNVISRRYLADLDHGRPFQLVAPDPLESPLLMGLVMKDGNFNPDHGLLTQGAQGLMNVSIAAAGHARGKYYSMVHVVGEPMLDMSHVEEVCLRHGFASRLGAIAVPEANRTIYMFDTTSPSKSVLQSAIGGLQQDLQSTPGVGRIEVTGKFGRGGGFGSGGGGFGSGGGPSW